LGAWVVVGIRADVGAAMAGMRTVSWRRGRGLTSGALQIVARVRGCAKEHTDKRDPGDR
jgi:hypothetical protein